MPASSPSRHWGFVSSKRVTLLTNLQNNGPLAEAVKAELKLQGYEIDHCVWGDTDIPTSQDLVSFIDIEDREHPLFRDITIDDLNYLLKLINTLSQSIILWLTKPA
jgi:hypothetical protein